MKKIILIIIAFLAFNFSNAQVPDPFPDGIYLGSSANDPTGYRVGQLWVKTTATDTTLRIFNGTNWKDVGGGGTQNLQSVLTEGNTYTSGLSLWTWAGNNFSLSYNGDPNITLATSLAGGGFNGGAINIDDTDDDLLSLTSKGVRFSNRSLIQAGIQYAELLPPLSYIGAASVRLPNTSGKLTHSITDGSTTVVSDDAGVVDISSLISGGSDNTIYRNVITSNTTLTAQDIDDFTQFYIDGTGITVTLPTTILAADEVKYLFFTAPNEDDFTVVGGAGVTFPSTVYSGVSKVALRSYVQNTWEEDTSYPSGGTQDLQQVTNVGAITDADVTVGQRLTLGDGNVAFLDFNDGQNTGFSADVGEVQFRASAILDILTPSFTKNSNEIISYGNTYNASTNSPTLANTDTGVTGTIRRVTVAGTQDFGAGNITFAIDDYVINDGTVWRKFIDNSGGSDNLGNHIATSTLDLNDNDIINVKDLQINDYGLGASANKIGLRGSYGLEISLDNTSSSSSERSWFFGNYLDRAMIAYAGGGGTFDRTSLDMNPVIGVNKRFIMPAKPAGTYTMATLEDLTSSGIDRTPVIVSDSTYTALEADLLNNKIHLFTNAVADSIRVTIPDIVKPNTDIIEFRARTMSETPITVIRDTIQFIPRIMDESFSIASTDDDVWVKWDNVNKVNWVDPGPVMGPELLLNTTFDNSTNVTVDGFNTWSIGGGVANFNDTRDNVDLTFTTNNITAGDYIFAYDIPSGAPRISLEVGATEVMGITFVSTGTQVEIPFTYAGADSTTFIVVAWSGAGGSAFDLDNVTLKKVQ